jgi:type I restriction enzyme S subunit
MSEWREVRLGDICTIVGRIGFRGYTAKDLVDSPDKGAISLSPTNIANYDLNLSKVTYISWEKYYESPEIMVTPGDIVFSKTGTVGWSAYIKEVVHPITLNPQLVVFKDIKINPVYLSYVMRSHLFKGLVKNITGGSAVPTLSQKDLGNLKFPVADSTTQNGIASILSSLDDKIAVNRRICENLEAQAQALFKHWFIDFAPFLDKPSGKAERKNGKFVESELGMIPEGWRVGKLGDVTEFLNGFAFKSSSFVSKGKYKVITIKAVQDGKLITDSADEIEDLPLNIPSHCVLKIGDILLSLTGNVGRVCIVTQDNLVLNQRVCILNPRNLIDRGYVYTLSRTKLLKTRMINIAKGTAQANLSPVETSKLSIVVPPRYILDKFGIIANEYMSEIISAYQENQRLSTLRDTLLPKLMSGQIKV